MANTTTMPGLMTGSISVGNGGPKKLSPQQKMNKAAMTQPVPIKYSKPIQQMPGSNVPVRAAKPNPWK